MSRGVDGREIFVDDRDRETFLRMLLQEKTEQRFHLFAYCLMGNHFHLLIQVEDSPLYSGMHRFLTRYSHYFNRRHLRPGHLFQSRYTAPMCRRDSYLETLLRYIHLNPVRAGLVTEPETWPWSGHRALAGLGHDPLMDLDALANLRGQSIEGLRNDYRETMKEPAIRQFDVIPVNPLIEKPALRAIASAVASEHGLVREELGNRGKIFTRAKLDFIEKALAHGHSAVSIAAEIGCSPAAVTQLRKRKVNFVPDPFVKTRGSAWIDRPS